MIIKTLYKPTIEYYIQDEPHPERICHRCQEEAQAAAEKMNYKEAVQLKREKDQA